MLSKFVPQFTAEQIGMISRLMRADKEDLIALVEVIKGDRVGLPSQSKDDLVARVLRGLTDQRKGEALQKAMIEKHLAMPHWFGYEVGEAGDEA